MSTKAERVADSAGVLGAVWAALCCLDVPFVVSSLTAVGLGFLRTDPILWPLMIVSLLVALWGMWRGWRIHGSPGPFAIALIAGAALVSGVIFVHGFPAREMIYAGAAGLIGATIWNVTARRRCERSVGTS